MAHKITKQLNNGFTAEYWRLEGMEVSKPSGKIYAYFSGYKDKATRQSGAKPVTSKEVEVKIADIDLSKDLFEEVYKASKTAVSGLDSGEPFFKDAVID